MLSNFTTTIYIHLVLWNKKLRNWLFTFPLARQLPPKMRINLCLILRVLVVLIISRLAVSLGYLFMDELSMLVAQFYPSVGMSSSGGATTPPGPSEDPSFFQWIPNENHDKNQDQPGPSASEGEGRALRDSRTELKNIEELRKDKYLGGSYRNALIRQENIIIEMKKSILSGNNISDDDIRKGVEIYLTGIMEMSNLNSRNRKLYKILRDLTDRGSASTHFNAIVKQIESLNDPFF